PPPFFFFRDRVSLYSPGCPGTHFVDQADLELRNPPASASRVLGVKACAPTPGSILYQVIAFHSSAQTLHILMSNQYVNNTVTKMCFASCLSKWTEKSS
ncbi:mCG9803, partial [Mus musculus]